MLLWCARRGDGSTQAASVATHVRTQLVQFIGDLHSRSWLECSLSLCAGMQAIRPMRGTPSASSDCMASAQTPTWQRPKPSASTLATLHTQAVLEPPHVSRAEHGTRRDLSLPTHIIPPSLATATATPSPSRISRLQDSSKGCALHHHVLQLLLLRPTPGRGPRRSRCALCTPGGGLSKADVPAEQPSPWTWT